MKVQIKDGAALSLISPAMMRSYLEARGWVYRGVWRSNTSVWAKEYNGQSQEILVPLHDSFSDYVIRVSEEVILLSEIEQRSQLDVYYDLLGAGADVIKLRSLADGGQLMLSICDSADLLAYTRDLLASAARAAEHPGKAVHRGRPSGTVAEYLRLVHPLPGYGAGYELTLHSPMPDMKDSSYLPFARRATLSLNDGLREAALAAERALDGAEISSFAESVSQGVSANFCEALAALSRQAQGISVSVAWAAVRLSETPGVEFAFAESSAGVLEAGAKWLRRNSPPGMRER